MVAATCIAVLSLVSADITDIPPAAPAAPIVSRAAVRLQIVSLASLPEGALLTAIDEAAAIWAPYGVTVTATRQLARSQDWHGDWLTLILRDGPSDDTGRIRADRRRPLADLVFSGGVPGHLMTGYWDVAMQMASAATMPRLGGDATLAARLLGRAVAHEIGHYLLKTPEHSTRGLMRVAFTVRDVLRTDPAGIRLERAQLLALEPETAGCHPILP